MPNFDTKIINVADIFSIIFKSSGNGPSIVSTSWNPDNIARKGSGTPGKKEGKKEARSRFLPSPNYWPNFDSLPLRALSHCFFFEAGSAITKALDL